LISTRWDDDGKVARLGPMTSKRSPTGLAGPPDLIQNQGRHENTLTEAILGVSHRERTS
jgi:hypothetical protein